MTNKRDRPRSSPSGSKFRVKKQNGNFFMVDNIVIDDYAAKIGPYALAVYCFFVRESWSHEVRGTRNFQEVADALSMSRRQVIRSVKILAGEDGSEDRSPTLSQPLIMIERVKTNRSKVPNKESIYTILSTDRSDYESPQGVTESHSPVTDVHSGVTDMHSGVTDMHSGVTDVHPYKDQDDPRRIKTIDQEGASPPFHEQNGNGQNGATTSPSPPPSPSFADAYEEAQRKKQQARRYQR